MRGHPFDNIDSRGIPDCKGPVGPITLLIALRYVTILHFPDFFLTDTREFQRLADSSTW